MKFLDVDDRRPIASVSAIGEGNRVMIGPVAAFDIFSDSQDLWTRAVIFLFVASCLELLSPFIPRFPVQHCSSVSYHPREQRVL